MAHGAIYYVRTPRAPDTSIGRPRHHNQNQQYVWGLRPVNYHPMSSPVLAQVLCINSKYRIPERMHPWLAAQFRGVEEPDGCPRQPRSCDRAGHFFWSWPHGYAFEKTSYRGYKCSTSCQPPTPQRLRQHHGQCFGTPLGRRGLQKMR